MTLVPLFPNPFGVGASLTRQEKVLLRMFREGPEGFKGGLSAGSCSMITGASPATATRDLVDLIAKGALVRVALRRAPNSRLTHASHLPVRQLHAGLPLLLRNRSVSVPLTSSRARITSDAPCFTFEPVTAIWSPLLKLMPISS